MAQEGVIPTRQERRIHWSFPLKTHHVAKIFSVSPNTVLSWIRKAWITAPARDENEEFLWTANDLHRIAKFRYPNAIPIPVPRTEYRKLLGNNIPIVISANQKGGVGKTTTVFNLIGPISEFGRRALILDFDNQRNTTRRIYGKVTSPREEVNLDADFLRNIQLEEEEIRRESPNEKTVLDFYTEKTPLAELIRPSRFPLVDYIPGSKDIWKADQLLEKSIGLQHRLREEFKNISGEYDIILIDMPANVINGLGVWTVMLAATGAIIPLIPSDLAWDAVKDLRVAFDELRQVANPNFLIYGFLLNQYKGNTNFSKDFWQGFRAETQATAFETVLKHVVTFEEAMHAAEPMSRFAPNSEHADAYRQVLAELEAFHITFYEPIRKKSL